MKHAPVLLLWLVNAVIPASAQLFFQEPFSYPDGLIVGASGSPWVNNYQPAGQAAVVGGRLVLTDTRQESIRYNFTNSVNTGKVFASFTVNFSALPSGDGNIFAFFRAAGVDNLRARVWAATNDAAPGKFRLGIYTIFEPATMVTADLSLHTDYLLVTSYDITNAISTLWINPTHAADTSLYAAHSDGTDVGLPAIGHFGFAQRFSFQNSGNIIGSLTVDNLRLGRSFNDVFPSRFTSVSSGAGGSIRLSGLGAVGTNYTIMANTNLATTDWLNVGNAVADANGALQFTDTNAPNFRQRFYQLRQP